MLKLQEKVLGPEHYITLDTRGNLINALFDQGKYAEAETQGRNLIMLQTKVLGPEHFRTLGTRMNLAIALDQRANMQTRKQEDGEVIKLEEKVLGPEHPDTLLSRMNLANDDENLPVAVLAPATADVPDIILEPEPRSLQTTS